MDKYSEAALYALCETWGGIHAEALEPDNQAQLWRMAEHMCIAFAMQHEYLESEVTETFTFLAGIAHAHQVLELQGPREPVGPKIETVSSLPAAIRAGLRVH